MELNKMEIYNKKNTLLYDDSYTEHFPIKNVLHDVSVK